MRGYGRIIEVAIFGSEKTYSIRRPSWMGTSRSSYNNSDRSKASNLTRADYYTLCTQNPHHSREGNDGSTVTHCHPDEFGFTRPEQAVLFVFELLRFTKTSWK